MKIPIKEGGNCSLSVPCKFFCIDHFRTRWTAKNALRLYHGRGRFHQVFNYSGSGENLVDTGDRYTAEAGYSPHVHYSVMPFLFPPHPCLRSRINYARYLHTKRPGKIKNTNSEREAPHSPHLVRSLTPRQPRSALHFLSRSPSLVLYDLRASAIYRPSLSPKRYRRYRIIAPGHQSCKLPSAESRNHKFSGNQMIHRAALPDGPATTSLQRDTSIVELANTALRVTAMNKTLFHINYIEIR